MTIQNLSIDSVAADTLEEKRRDTINTEKCRHDISVMSRDSH